MIVRVPANPHIRDLISKKDDDGSENVGKKKMNLRSFKLNRVYLDPLKMSNAGDFPGVEFVRILFRFKTGRKIRRRLFTSSRLRDAELWF